MKSLGRFAFLLSLIFSLGLLTGCEVTDRGHDGGEDEPAAATTGGARKKVVGTWKVVTPWRWSQMTFNADGTRSVVDASTGKTISRGTWHLANGKLVVVSDVTETWSYAITGSTMNATLPSGTQIQMLKLN